MTTDTDTKTKPTRKLLKIERLEPYLKFPSGLSLKQAKQNAKAHLFYLVKKTDDELKII